MKIIQKYLFAFIGAVIVLAGAILSIATYVSGGNKAYSLCLLFTFVGITFLVVAIKRVMVSKEKSLIQVTTLTQAALCTVLCYIGATFIKFDIPVGNESTMFHLAIHFAYWRRYL